MRYAPDDAHPLHRHPSRAGSGPDGVRPTVSTRRANGGGRRRAGARGRPSRAWLVAVALLALVILWLTLMPAGLPGDPAATNLKPLEHHGRALRALLDGPPHRANRDAIVRYLVGDVLGNVLLFVPLGLAVAGAAGAGRSSAARLTAAGGAGAGLSLAVEALQLLVPGRATDVDDVIFNTLGALVGGAALLVAERLYRRGARKRRRPVTG